MIDTYERPSYPRVRFRRYRAGAIGAGLYLFAGIFAAAYPQYSNQAFAPLPVDKLAWPWLNYFSFGDVAILLGICLNALLLYLALGVLSTLFSRTQA
jgi:hypothetical protein